MAAFRRVVEQASVSMSTVACIVNQNGCVKDEMRQPVIQAIPELNADAQHIPLHAPSTEEQGSGAEERHYETRL